MTPMNLKRWETARQQMVRRWEEIVRRIDARDEGPALALANLLDEFCELAAVERQAAAGRRDDPAVPVLKFPADAALSGRCAFCRALVSHGGCFGPTHALNKAMLDRRWDEARRVASEQLERLRRLTFEPPEPGETVH
jgi:hypothetical protein